MKVSIESLVKENISGEWGNDPIDNNAVNVIRTANFINSGKINLSNIVLRNIDEKKIKAKRLFKGDVIIEKSGGSPTQPVGRVVYFNEEGIFLTNNFTSTLRPDTNLVYPKYFFYSLFELHKKGKTLKYQNKTTGIINLKLKDYLKEEILLPSYKDQIRIANLLEKIEIVIAERKSAIDLLDELVKSTFYKMFGDPVRNEKGWKKNGLSSIGKIERGISKHRPRNASELLGGIYPLVQTGDVSKSGLWLKNYTQTYSELGLKQSKLWPRGTLLITIAANIAKTSVLNFDACFPDSIVGYVADIDKSNVVFVHYLLGFYQETLEKNAPQSAQKNINLGILKNLLLPIPPIDLQNQFADIAQKIEDLKEEQEAQLKGLEELYAAVSQKVFNGELDLSKIPYDEALLPKEINLDKIPVKEEVLPEYSRDIVEFSQENVRQDEVMQDEVRQETKSVSKNKLQWERISFKEVANYIKHEFEGHHFNAEMLLRYLTDDMNIYIDYFSTAVQKKHPQYENADDFYSFIATALTGENIYLQLEQVFYNAETENISDISFTDKDLKVLTKKTPKERSGIYFRIKDEITTS